MPPGSSSSPVASTTLSAALAGIPARISLIDRAVDQQIRLHAGIGVHDRSVLNQASS
jgi:hypothetical protein